MTTVSYQSTSDSDQQNAEHSGPTCIGCSLELDGQSYCPECQTPSDISTLVQRRDVQPNFVSILGASNAGKTVYLGLLSDVLANATGNLRGTANGTFSIALQENVVSSLEKRFFPDKTPVESDNWRWLHCEVSMKTGKKEKQYDFIAPDIAGEAISFELEQDGSYRAILNIVGNSGGILLLCDSTEVRDAGSQEDLYALKLASYIQELQPETKKRKTKNTPAIAIVLTKCDECPEAFENPELFAKNNMPRFYDFCERHFPKHQFFGSGIVGSSCVIRDSEAGDRLIPLDVQPRGVLEPLHWVIEQL